MSFFSGVWSKAHLLNNLDLYKTVLSGDQNNVLSFYILWISIKYQSKNLMLWGAGEIV